MKIGLLSRCFATGSPLHLNLGVVRASINQFFVDGKRSLLRDDIKSNHILITDFLDFKQPGSLPKIFFFNFFSPVDNSCTNGPESEE